MFFIFKVMIVLYLDYFNFSFVFFRKVFDIIMEDIKCMIEKYDCGCKVLNKF